MFIFILFCNLLLERSSRKLQLCSWKHFNHNAFEKVMITQSFKHICSLGNMNPPLSNHAPKEKGA
jgi:hypothetical protein